MGCGSILRLCVWGIICQKNVLLYFTVNGSLMSWCLFELAWNKKMQPYSHTECECDEIISITSLYLINLTLSLQESFSSMKYLLLVTLFYSVLLPLLWTSPTSTLKPGSPVAFYLECRLQREAGILFFEICECLWTSHLVFGIQKAALFLFRGNVSLLMGQYSMCFLNILAQNGEQGSTSATAKVDSELARQTWHATTQVGTTFVSYLSLHISQGVSPHRRGFSSHGRYFHFCYLKRLKRSET